MTYWDEKPFDPFIKTSDQVITSSQFLNEKILVPISVTISLLPFLTPT